MIDSHCHLDHEPLFTDLKNVVSRSKSIGIDKLLTICTTKKGYDDILKIVEFDLMIYGTFGIHPHEASKDIINKAVGAPQILAIQPTLKKPMGPEPMHKVNTPSTRLRYSGDAPR